MFALDAGSAAQAIFVQGPETVIASSPTIVTGPPTGVVVSVEKESAGSSPVPLEWTVSGAVVKPVLLKGPTAPPAITFRRRERARFAVADAATPQWELDLGSAGRAASVVLFFSTADSTEPATILPSPTAGLDVARLVADIVRIQAIPDASDRIDAWRAYATSASSDDGRMAALRSLVASGAPWPAVADTWRECLGPAGTVTVRSFAFKLMLFALSEGRWPEDVRDILALARELFRAETDSRLALDYTDGLILLHHAAVQNRERVPGAVETVRQTLRDRETLGPDADAGNQAINEAYRQLRDACLTSASPVNR